MSNVEFSQAPSRHSYHELPSFSAWRAEGVLHYDGVYWLAANEIVVDDGDGGLMPEYESPFASLDFHTAVLGSGIHHLCEGCFNGCRGLRRIILSESVEAIEWPIALDTQVEYFNDKGLLFLGTERNPRHALMGCADDFAGTRVIVPSETKVIATGIPWPEQVAELQMPTGEIIKIDEE